MYLMFHAGAKQKTLIKPVSISGIGLHTNEQITLTLRPAAANSGIIFRRIDLPAPESLILAHFDTVTETQLGTVISNNAGHKISTIEHLMAAISANGIDNLIIDCNGNEVPVMDGSSEPFMALIADSGVKTLDAPKKYIRILKDITVREGDKFATISPFDGFKMKFEIEFASSVIGYQAFESDFSQSFFQSELASARTFGFIEEVEMLKKMGLARGGSLDNAIVIEKDTILNETGLRFDDEFVRHKMLDAVGDLALAQYPIIGAYHGYKSGHGLNNQLLHALLSDSTAYSLVTSPVVNKRHLQSSAKSKAQSHHIYVTQQKAFG
ncbi:MAG: UDP-3-O-[3-hydroxymyristoyl] N-acetylglucosamine deacetylase [Alphaproteobacteria bacterium]|jgi:UDP-3-O-[3-hydroxymyristoyl] N-acetylglucosamine deacetylase